MSKGVQLMIVTPPSPCPIDRTIPPEIACARTRLEGDNGRNNISREGIINASDRTIRKKFVMAIILLVQLAFQKAMMEEI